MEAAFISIEDLTTEFEGLHPNTIYYWVRNKKIVPAPHPLTGKHARPYALPIRQARALAQEAIESPRHKSAKLKREAGDARSA